MKRYLTHHPDSFRITGIAHSVGSNCFTNEQLINTYGINIKESFIQKSIGIRTRYFISDDKTTSDLAVNAAQAALEKSGVSVNELDRIIVATSTPDHPTPSTASIVQYKLGGKHFPASDIVAACSGFLYGLDQALRCLATGDEKILLIGVDCRSRTLNMQDKRTAFLYGDGAGAVVLERVKGDCTPGRHSGFTDCIITADGQGHDAVLVPVGGAKEPCTVENVQAMRHKLSMPSGQRVAQNALEGFVYMTKNLLERNDLNLDDIDLFIFHQPNRRLLEVVMQNLGIGEDKTFINFDKYGNTVAGSIPIALSEAVDHRRLVPGNKILLCAVGGGFTAGAALYHY